MGDQFTQIPKFDVCKKKKKQFADRDWNKRWLFLKKSPSLVMNRI